MIKSPLDLPGVTWKLWVDASRITGKNDGDAISQWDDNGGANNHLLQATGTKQMLYKVVSGVPSVRSDGSNDYMAAAMTDDRAMTVIVVAKKLSALGATPQTCWGLDPSTDGHVALTAYSSISLGWTFYPNSVFGASDMGGVSPTTTQIAVCRFSTTGPLVDMHSGGVPAGRATPTANFGDWANFYIGGWGTTPTEPGDYDYYEILVADSELTNFQIAELLDYLSVKWTLVGRTPHYIAQRGTGGDTTGAASTTVTMATAASIIRGNTLLAYIAVDNSGTNGAEPGVSSITDAKGNVWTQVGSTVLNDPGAANAGCTLYMFQCTVDNPYANSDTVIFNWTTGSPPAKAIIIEEWSNLGVTAVAATSATGASTTPSVSRTPTGPGQVFIGVVAAECGTADTYTADTDTTEGTWMPVDRTGFGTTTSGPTIARQYKIVQAPGTTAQTFNPTLGTSRDWCALGVVFDRAPRSMVPPSRRRAINRVLVTR